MSEYLKTLNNDKIIESVSEILFTDITNDGILNNDLSDILYIRDLNSFEFLKGKKLVFSGGITNKKIEEFCKSTFLKDYKENDSDVSFALGRYLFNKESTIHKIKKIINNFVQI